MELLSPKAFSFKEIFANVKADYLLYVAFAVVLIVLVCFFIFTKKQKRDKLSKTQKLCYTAMFTALATLANFLAFFPVPSVAVSFTWTVCFVSAYLLGAKSAFCVGFIGDLLGAIIFPAGVYNPLIGLASGFMGLIPGIVFDYFKGNLIIKTVVSALLTFIICTAGLNTFALWLMYAMGKKSFFVYLFGRLPWQMIIAFINFVVSMALGRFLSKVLSKSKFNLSA